MKIILRLLLAAALLAVMILAAAPVQAVGGSYKFDFSAAAPRFSNPPYDPTYPRYTPDGLACPTPSGGTGQASNPLLDAIYASPLSPYPTDAVESLSPGSLALGQIVPFENALVVNGSTAREGGVISFAAQWSTKSTSHDDYGYDPAYMVYCAYVDSGDKFASDPGGDAKVDFWTNSLVNPSTVSQRPPAKAGGL